EPGLRLSYAVFVFATIGGFVFRITVQSMLPLFAGSQLGFTATQVGILFSISGIIITAMILPAGFLLDKLGRKWATVPSMLLPGIAFLLIPFSETFLQLTVLIAVVGVSNGLSLGSLATSTYDVVPVHARGRLQALRRSVAEIGGVGAPLFGGVLANPTIQACRSCCTRPYCCWPDSCWRSWRRRRWSRSPQTRT
ncbi:MAG: MFS transporter, partial [Dehalococcoidia bacterium]